MPSRLTAVDHRTTEADLEHSCWLFLAREPETRTDPPEPPHDSLAFLIASLLVSDEFKARLGLVEGRLVISETMLVRLSPDLLEWLISVAGPGFVWDEPADRLTVIRKFLTDDRTRDAVNAIGSQHIYDIDALNAALVQLDEVVRIVGTSGLFDAVFYRSQVFAGARVGNVVAHYVLHGERLGLNPSPAFEAGKYAELNPDVAASSVNRLFHYEMWGRQEGRIHRHWPADHAMPPVVSDTGRPTVLLLIHEATYTGAPILGWNLARALSDYCNVVVVLRRGGALESALCDVAAAVVAAPPCEATLDPGQMDRFAERLVAAYRPLYVIANSIECQSIAITLRRKDIPIVALVHEFWPGARPGVRLDFYAGCAALVFPAHLVEQSSFHAFREIRLQNRFILPQGPCVIPPFDQSLPPRAFGPPFVTGKNDAPASLETLLTHGRRGTGPFTVIGLGAVEMRKGPDLFISAATAMKAKHPEMPFRFIWIGTWEHAIGSQYAALLDEQSNRSALGDQLHFFPAVDDLEPIYARADALFLSSRLDPLPNIAIDAAFRGIPVVCFDGASGTAELLKTDAETAALVVPHLDSGAAADRIAELAQNAGLWATCSEAIQRLAQRSFDMAAYARALDEIGRDAARKFKNTDTDRRLIEDANVFDPSLYFVSDHGAALATTVTVYADQTRHINFASPPVFGVILRRPKAGFHPFIYGTEAPDFPHNGSRDPLAHYVERGMPQGRWNHRVLRPDLIGPAGDTARGASPEDTETGRRSDVDRTSVALHGHFHYPDNIGDFMTALAANRLRSDLFLTTTSNETAEILRTATDSYQRGNVVVEVGPNIGRDIYAFLSVLRTHIHGRYEMVGHIHGKRTVHTVALDPEYGDRWRRFLWEHLLGSSYAAADLIVDAMRSDDRLGLVFPENGYLIGWEKNGDSAAALARRIGLHGPLPSHIEFPAGTMFWARVAALETLVQANLREEEMPVEPLPIDGTVLHALERMLPILCEDAGYTYATSYIPHIKR